MRKATIALATLALVSATAHAQNTAVGNDAAEYTVKSDQDRAADLKAGRLTSQPRVLKYCSIFAPGLWRSHFYVGGGWTAAQCAAVGRPMGATAFQLYCMSTDGAWASGNSWSGNNPGTQQLPGDNTCGWAL